MDQPPPPSTSSASPAPSFLIPTSHKPPVSRKRKVHQRTSLDVRNVSNKRPRRLPVSLAISETLTAREGFDDLPVLEYDLDRDPTQEVYEFRDQFHERSTLSAMLSARSVGVFGSPHPPPGYCDLDCGGSAHVTDQFIVPTLDDGGRPLESQPLVTHFPK